MIRTRKIETETSTDIPHEEIAAKKGKKLFIIQSIAFLVCCLVIGRSRGSFFSLFQSAGDVVKSAGHIVSNSTRSMFSSAIGKEPVLDAQWNINVALLGYWWGMHDGTYLTDSIIIASINAKKWTMSMLSIPRDLYVKKKLWNYGKINSLYEWALYRNEKNIDLAAKEVIEKLQEITNITIPYYAMIDFKWFEEFVDSLGGIDIDVSEPIYDSSYPGENNSYIIFSIDSGEQLLDGATALKYARSRHSTSDFSRSMRQQAIIQAITEKITSAKTILNPARMKDTYTNFTRFVKTNFSLEETLRWIPYIGSLNHKASRQIAACWSSNRQQAQAGCLLYTPPQEAFGGASVQVPNGASPSSVSTYTYIHSFVEDTMMNTDFVVEKPMVRILNGVGTGNKNPLAKTPLANTTATLLVEAGFTVYDAKNADVPQTKTTITTNGAGREASIKKLSVLFPGVAVSKGPKRPDGPSIVIVIGDDYDTIIKARKTKLPLYLQ
jgi:polyisoprenyl-teichoic acid--peptidoglycan teichoic acid transferase